MLVARYPSIVIAYYLLAALEHILFHFCSQSVISDVDGNGSSVAAEVASCTVLCALVFIRMIFALDHNLCEKHGRKPEPKDESNVYNVHTTLYHVRCTKSRLHSADNASDRKSERLVKRIYVTELK